MAGRGPRQRDKGWERRPGVRWRPREPSGPLSRMLCDGAQAGTRGGPAELEGRAKHLRRFPRAAKGCRGPGPLQELPDASLGRVDGGGGAWGRGQAGEAALPLLPSPCPSPGAAPEGCQEYPQARQAEGILRPGTLVRLGGAEAGWRWGGPQP